MYDLQRKQTQQQIKLQQEISKNILFIEKYPLKVLEILDKTNLNRNHDGHHDQNDDGHDQNDGLNFLESHKRRNEKIK